MRECYHCGDEITEENQSIEHIIPNACGGRLKSSEILCKDCNNRLGHQIDSELARQVNGFMVILGADRENGQVPPIVTRVAGTAEEVRMTADGKLEKRGAPEIIPWQKEGTSGIDFVANDHAQFRQLLKAYQRKYPNMVFSANINDPKTTQTYLDSPLKLSFEINNLFKRAILKIALNFYVHNAGQRRTILPLLPQLDGTAELSSVRMYQPDDGYYKPGPNEVSHILKLIGDPKEQVLYCYVELFNANAFLVTLSKEYEGPALDETYVYDILTQEILVKPVILIFTSAQLERLKEYPIYDPEMIAFRKRVARVANIDNKWDAERYKHHLFNECMAEARQGKIVTPENWETTFMDGIRLFSERYARWQANRQALAKKMAAGEFRASTNEIPQRTTP